MGRRIRTTIYIEKHCKLYAKMMLNLSDFVNEKLEELIASEGGRDRVDELIRHRENQTSYLYFYCDYCKTTIPSTHHVSYCPNCNKKVRAKKTNEHTEDIEMLKVCATQKFV